MAKYLVSKAYKLERRAAVRAKLQDRTAWTKPDVPAVKTPSKRRLAAVLALTVATLASPVRARGVHTWPHSGRHSSHTGGHHTHHVSAASPGHTSTRSLIRILSGKGN